MRLLFIGLFLLTSNLFAVSAFPGEITFTQNDGTTFKGHLKGDEWLNFVSLPNDYVAVYNKESKNYEYARIELKDGKQVLISTKQKVDESLHLNNPEELAKQISPLDSAQLSQLHRPRNKAVERHHKHHVHDQNTSTQKRRVIKTKSTQWKEIIKEKPAKDDRLEK